MKDLDQTLPRGLQQPRGRGRKGIKVKGVRGEKDGKMKREEAAVMDKKLRVRRARTLD